jgi:hypothetical protein
MGYEEDLAKAISLSLDSSEQENARNTADQSRRDSELAAQLQAAEETEGRARAKLEAQRAQREASLRNEARKERERANLAEQKVKAAQKARDSAYKLNSERNAAAALRELASTRKALISVAREAKEEARLERLAREEARSRQHLVHRPLFPLTPSSHGHWHNGPYGNWDDGGSGPSGGHSGHSGAGGSGASGSSSKSDAFYKMCAGAGANGVHKCTEAAMRAYPANVALSWHHEAPPSNKHTQKYSPLLSAVVGYWDPAPKSEYDKALHGAKVAQLYADCNRIMREHGPRGPKGITTVAEALGACIFVWSESKWKLYHSGADCSEGAVYIAEKNGKFTRLRPIVVSGSDGPTGLGGPLAHWGYKLGFGATHTEQFNKHVVKIGGA